MPSFFMKIFWLAKAAGWLETFLMYGNREALLPLFQHLKIPHGTVRPADSSVRAVICWGKNNSVDSAPGVPFLLNPVPLVQQTEDKDKMSHLLEINGLSVVRKSSSAGRIKASRLRIKIPVFHLEALAVFQDRKGTHLITDAANPCKRYSEITFQDDDKQVHRFIQKAIRAIYALGLDFGLVHLRLDTDGVIAVENVEPWPSLDDRLGELFAEAIHRFNCQLSEELKRNGPPLIGMDPEFVLVGGDDRLVSAERFLRRRGKVGCDAVTIRGKICYPLAELRPDPAEEPRELMIHLWQTMRSASRMITDENLKWLAGGMPKKGFPLGGHLHLSRVWLNSKLLRALDNYLALPLLLLEPDSSRSRRPYFGCLGDFRLKPHGGFEYRTLPSWLVSPVVTRGVIALTRVIVDHYRELDVFPLTEGIYQNLYYAGEKQELLEIVQILWAKLEPLSGYQRYRKDLNLLKSRIYRLESWDEQRDLRKTWQIR